MGHGPDPHPFRRRTWLAEALEDRERELRFRQRPADARTRLRARSEVSRSGQSFDEVSCPRRPGEAMATPGFLPASHRAGGPGFLDVGDIQLTADIAWNGFGAEDEDTD